MNEHRGHWYDERDPMHAPDHYWEPEVRAAWAAGWNAAVAAYEAELAENLRREQI